MFSKPPAPQFLYAVLAALIGAWAIMAQQEAPLSENDAEAIATEAYIYGYPLITMDMTRQVMTNVAVPEGTKAPLGQFANLRTYPDARFKDVTAPNADTLYSSAWLDLAKEPLVLHVPDEQGRYYLMPMLSGWTEVFQDPGSRTTGTSAADYVITGPNWKGTLPSGLKEIKSPTNMVWILGRTYCTGTPEDYQAVHDIQDQYTLTPLSFFGKPYIPPRGLVDPTVDTKTAVRAQVNNLDAPTFFKRLALLLKDSPPAADDVAIIDKMERIGIIVGHEFDPSKLDPAVVRGLEKAPQRGITEILAQEKKTGELVNGWQITLETGKYGTDYSLRALVTAIGLGANLPQDAVYPITHLDSAGQPLNGKNRYVLHFPKGQAPPAKGFWSLTLYNDQYFFVANPLNRYTLSPRNALKYNEDGSLDLHIQQESPGKDQEANWLPAPADDFILMLRLYWPEEQLLKGTWKPPAVQKVQ